MVFCQQLENELNRLGVKSAYVLCQSTIRVLINQRGRETEIVIPNPQIAFDKHTLTIHFHGYADIGSMIADSVNYAPHLGRWLLRDAPGYSYQGEAPEVSVEILREQRFCLSSDGV